MIGLLISYWRWLRDTKRRTNAMGRNVMAVAEQRRRTRGTFQKGYVPRSRLGGCC